MPKVNVGSSPRNQTWAPTQTKRNVREGIKFVLSIKKWTRRHEI